MKTLLKIVLVLAILLVLVAGGGSTWAKGRGGSILARTIETHVVDFPIPFPLDSAEIAEPSLTPDEADSLARRRAVVSEA